MKTKDFVVKVIGFAILAISLSVGFSHANCGNDNGNGNGCSGNNGSTGPQGQQGPQGNPGVNGSNGNNGTNGTNGINGPQSVDPRMNESKLALDTAVRLYDGKRTQLQVYNVYSFGTHPCDDVFGQGHNLQYGVRFIVKLGRSYEEELLEKQQMQIKALENLVSRLSN